MIDSSVSVGGRVETVGEESVHNNTQPESIKDPEPVQPVIEDQRKLPAPEQHSPEFRRRFTLEVEDILGARVSSIDPNLLKAEGIVED